MSRMIEDVKGWQITSVRILTEICFLKDAFLAVAGHTGQKPFRRHPGWTKVPPINVVILHRHKERETEIEDCSGWGRYSRPAALPYHCCYCPYIAVQMAHPATCTIALHSIDPLSTRPLIEQIREINPCAHSMGDRHIEARINFHQVGFPDSVAPKLHLRVAFQADFPH